MYVVPYRRYSSKTQVSGNSELRQDSGFTAFLASSGLKSAPPEFCYWDKGKSGFKGDHRAGEFGKMLADAERQAWEAGSIVWFEDMDRFSRQKLSTVLHDLETIEAAGYSVHVGSLSTTSTSETEDTDRIPAILKSIWAREESAKKAKRLSASWQAKRERADGLTKHGCKSKVCPKWLSVSKDGSTYELNDKAALMRKAALMAIAGHGITSIRRLTGLDAGLLTQLHSRTLIGEWQPQSRGLKRAKLGSPKTNFYPAVLSKDEFNQLQLALKSRVLHKAKRTANFANLFTGILFNQDGKRMNAAKESRGTLTYRPSDRKGKTVLRAVVETAILNLFVNEITPATLKPQQRSMEAAELSDIEATIADKKEKREQVRQSFMEEKANGFLIETMNNLTEQIGSLEVVAEELRAVLSLAKLDTLGEVADLASHLDGLSGADLTETRIQLSGAIGKLVKRIDLQIDVLV